MNAIKPIAAGEVGMHVVAERSADDAAITRAGTVASFSHCS